MSERFTFDTDIVSDLHKDVYGMRPGYSFWEEWNNATDGEKQVIWDHLLDNLSDAVEEDKLRQAKAIESFENLVVKHIQTGAKDRADAIAWMCDAYEVDNAPGTYGWEHLEYHLGLPYGYISGVKPGFKS